MTKFMNDLDILTESLLGKWRNKKKSKRYSGKYFKILKM